MNPARSRAYIYLVIVILIWGIAGVVIKLTLDKLPWDIILLYRFLISSVIFIPFIKPSYIRLLRHKETLTAILIYTLLNTTLGLGLLFSGTARTSLVSMSLLSLFGPILTILGGYYFLKDKITWTEKLGITITFFGSLLIIIEPLIKFNGIQGDLIGNILILGSLACGPFSAIILKKLLRQGANPTFLANINFYVGLITFIPIVLIIHGFSGSLSIIKQITLPYHIAIWYLAVISGTIAYSLANAAQKTIEISEQAVFNYIYPIISAVLAVWLLKESMNPLSYFGAGVTVVGIIVAEFKRQKKRTTLEDAPS